jgi:HSP20 family protein
MTGIIRRRALPQKVISRKEFLTPFDELFNSLLNNSFPSLHNDLGTNFFSQGSYPKCNVVNFDDKVEIEAAIPGLTRNDITVEVSDGVLVIKGESNQREDISDAQYVKREVKRSAFARSFTLDENLNQDEITAVFDNGMLILSIPKREEVEIMPQIRRISIS